MPYTPPEMQEAYDALIECALDSSLAYGPDESHDPIPADELHEWDDVPEAVRTEVWDDLNEFMAFNEDDLRASGLTPAQIGHEFWLTRERHGTGFWDSDLDDIGRRLTEAAHVYGEVDLQLWYRLDDDGNPVKEVFP